MPHAPAAKNHTELVVWQLCSQLRALVLKYTRSARVREDRRYYTDIRAAARSACYLTSEGFYRKRDGDFQNFLVWARGSLGEVSDQVSDGQQEGYFSAEQAEQMISLVSDRWPRIAGCASTSSQRDSRAPPSAQSPGRRSDIEVPPNEHTGRPTVRWGTRAAEYWGLPTPAELAAPHGPGPPK